MKFETKFNMNIICPLSVEIAQLSATFYNVLHKTKINRDLNQTIHQPRLIEISFFVLQIPKDVSVCSKKQGNTVKGLRARKRSPIKVFYCLRNVKYNISTEVA